MKKLLALLLALAMTLSLCACGGDSSGGGTQPVPAGTSDGQTEENDPEQTQPADTGAAYLTYDDLAQTSNSWVRLDEGDVKLQIDHPSGFAFEGQAGHDVASTNNYCFSMLMTHAEEPMPGASLEDAFYALLNGENGLHSTLRMINRASYSEVSPETEIVTLDCGKEAILFSGIQQLDDYGTLSDCPIWGYCTMLDEVPVIVCYVIFDVESYEEGVASERNGFIPTEDMEHYVTEMINTVRIVEE